MTYRVITRHCSCCGTGWVPQRRGWQTLGFWVDIGNEGGYWTKDRAEQTLGRYVLERCGIVLDRAEIARVLSEDN